MARTYVRWSRVAELPYRDAWVLRVAANLAIDETRRRRPLGAVAPAADSDEVMALRLALSAGLRSLPRHQRQAVALRYLAGLSDSKVAGALGISTGSVKTHLHRGRAALRAGFGASVDLEVMPVGME